MNTCSSLCLLVGLSHGYSGPNILILSEPGCSILVVDQHVNMNMIAAHDPSIVGMFLAFPHTQALFSQRHLIVSSIIEGLNNDKFGARHQMMLGVFVAMGCSVLSI